MESNLIYVVQICKTRTCLIEPEATLNFFDALRFVDSVLVLRCITCLERRNQMAEQICTFWFCSKNEKDLENLMTVWQEWARQKRYQPETIDPSSFPRTELSHAWSTFCRSLFPVKAGSWIWMSSFWIVWKVDCLTTDLIFWTAALSVSQGILQRLASLLHRIVRKCPTIPTPEVTKELQTHKIWKTQPQKRKNEKKIIPPARFRQFVQNRQRSVFRDFSFWSSCWRQDAIVQNKRQQFVYINVCARVFAILFQSVGQNIKSSTFSLHNSG